MAYITLNQLAEAYGSQELSELLADEEGLLSRDLLNAALAGLDLSGYSGEEQTAVALAIARGNQVLARQSALMDSKLGVVYRTPLSASDAADSPVIECCLALSRAGLADDADNIAEHVTKERDHWRAWLRDIAAGKATLPGIATLDSANPGQRRMTAKVGSAVNWDQY